MHAGHVNHFLSLHLQQKTGRKNQRWVVRVSVTVFIYEMTRLEQIHVYFYPLTWTETEHLFLTQPQDYWGTEKGSKNVKKKQTKENKFTQVDVKSNSNTSS